MSVLAFGNEYTQKNKNIRCVLLLVRRGAQDLNDDRCHSCCLPSFICPPAVSNLNEMS